ncbi:hypothetical protein Nepgr_017227 [Nepenthes gracilis]|uniref:Small-subunit processome Utp12 domain-containing protein n=1 Tax=Nepenthes gracilis TaxID=150966 RepID=A0AAD3SRM4_NEPGR|nr:hypothetical protein Nepgr_017227 [Nepenthes gracilis]
MGCDDKALEASVDKVMRKKSKNKRGASDPDDAFTEKTIDISFIEATDGMQIDDNEPTIAEKLSVVDLTNNGTAEVQEMQEPTLTQLPSADSVIVLLKQALHADDRGVLLDCLYNQDEKVIANSISLLNPADIFKLLDSLIFIVQSRGAVLVCALPWLRSLLLQHASRIMSQESSLVALNSLYQLIESRVSTFGPASRLSSYLDYLCAGITDDGVDEFDSIVPVVYDDKDESVHIKEKGNLKENNGELNAPIQALLQTTNKEEGNELHHRRGGQTHRAGRTDYLIKDFSGLIPAPRLRNFTSFSVSLISLTEVLEALQKKNGRIKQLNFRFWCFLRVWVAMSASLG